MQRNFEGIWIPKDIWLDQSMGWSEKLLFVEIKSLANNGECFASNEYFAKFLGVHKKHISRLVSNLSEMGLVRVELIYKPNSKQIDKRIIHVPTRNENVPTPTQECSYPMEENVPTPRNKNVEDNSFINNTDFNNTVNNTININKKINKKNSDLENQFESLWKEYPRKLGSKKKARESYINALKKGNATYEQVQYGIEMYKKYIDYHNISEEFVKHGSTWFNQECWSNDYTCKPKVIQGRRHGFLGLVLNEMDYEKSQENVMEYEESVINGQETSGSTISHVTNSLPFGL